MRFERTTDYELVQQLLTDPRVYRRMANDEAPARENFRAVVDRKTEVILARDTVGPAGVFLLIDQGREAEVHFCLMSWHWGETEAIGRAFIEWAWIHTAYERLIGPVPAYNRLALRLAKNCGFERFDRKPDAVEKHGRPYDLVLLELRRPLHHD